MRDTQLRLDCAWAGTMMSFDDIVITTPPATSLDAVPLTPIAETFAVPSELAGQLGKTNQLLMWVDSVERTPSPSFGTDDKKSGLDYSWKLSWRKPDRETLIHAILDKSGSCQLKDTHNKPILIVERWDKSFAPKNARIGVVKTIQPAHHQILTVEQLTDGSSRILQLHIDHPSRPMIRIIKIEPTSAKCICCFLCTTASKFELSITDGMDEIGTISGSILRQTPVGTLENSAQYPTPYLLMTANFHHNVDSETKLLVTSGVMVGAIQQVFLFFDQQKKE